MAENKVAVVAECSVTSPEGPELVQGFDNAWARMRELGKTMSPITLCFERFVRKDPK